MASAVIAYTHNLNGGTDVTCKNIITGQPVTRTLKIDSTQLMEWHCNPRMLVQDVFPQLSAADREFLMTGISEEEWDKMMGEEE